MMIDVPEFWCAPTTDTIFLKRKGCKKIVELKEGMWWIDRNTPRGDDAVFYENKPYGGKRSFDKKEVIGIAIKEVDKS